MPSPNAATLRAGAGIASVATTRRRGRTGSKKAHPPGRAFFVEAIERRNDVCGIIHP